MTEQPTALRLADYCDGLADEIDHSHFTDDLRSSAAELRRLSVVEAQHDALLAALRKCSEQLTRLGYSANHADQAIAAIKQAEGENT